MIGDDSYPYTECIAWPHFLVAFHPPAALTAPTPEARMYHDADQLLAVPLSVRRCAERVRSGKVG
jgi:DNA-binding IclR family transcriptional regulator